MREGCHHNFAATNCSHIGSMVSAAELQFAQAAQAALIEHVGEEAVLEKAVIKASMAVTLDGQKTVSNIMIASAGQTYARNQTNSKP